MILKASQRGGATALANHLMRLDDNEHVQVHEIKNFMSDDLHGALNEAHAVSKGTRCRQFLFSVSLNPPPDQAPSIEVFEDALTRIESSTGLTGQPRVVVFHEKEGRRHAHAMWSRIDAVEMKAINMSHFKLKLRDVSRELYLEHGWKMPRGLMNSAERDERSFSLQEYQIAKHEKQTPHDQRELMRECWAISDSKFAFEQSLKARGLVLARGDRRGHVAITTEGNILSVARYTGKKTKEVVARLGKPDSLPSVEEAKAQIAKDMTQTFKRHAKEAQDQKQRQIAELETRRVTMTEKHRAERERLDTGQEARRIAETRARSELLNKGFKGLWQKVTGDHARIQKRNDFEALECFRRDRDQRQRLVEVQLTARRALQVEIVAARSRHAEQLKEIRQDRDRYRVMAPAPRNVSNRPAAQFDKAKGMAQDQASDIGRTATRRRIPTPEERLQQRRNGETKKASARSKGPAWER